MAEEEEDYDYDYAYSDEDQDQDQDQGHDQGHDQGQEQGHGYEDFSNLEIVSKQESKTSSVKIKNKPRSMSVDSETSDITRKPNFKCGSCKKHFLLDKNQKMIRCTYCGYRILFKLRTCQYISYKTE